MSLVAPGLGHVSLGTWQLGLILLGIAELFLLTLRAVPHLMAPTPTAVVLGAVLAFGLIVFVACVTLHAAWLVRRHVVETEAVGRTTSKTYVPLPLDVRVRQAGPDLSGVNTSRGSGTPWFTAACLIGAGIAGFALLPSKWGLATVSGVGMGPTLSAGDRVLVDLHRVGRTVARGDIAILQSHD